MAQPGSQPSEPDAAVNWLGLPSAPLEGKLQADRPDFTECASTIPSGHAQLEGGYTFAYDDEKGHRVSEQTLPEFLLRLGLVDGLEFRLGWEGWSLTEDLFREKNDAGRTVRRDIHDDAGTDMTVGFKARLVEHRGLIPDLYTITELGLPTGGRTKTAGDVEPRIKWLWSYELTPRLSLSGNLNVAVLTSGRDRFFQTAASISVGYEMAEWLGTYLEYVALVPNSLETDAAHFVDGGFTFPITDNLQFDVRAGVGLNEEAPDFFTGAGFAIRW